MELAATAARQRAAGVPLAPPSSRSASSLPSITRLEG